VEVAGASSQRGVVSSFTLSEEASFYRLSEGSHLNSVEPSYPRVFRHAVSPLACTHFRAPSRIPFDKQTKNLLLEIKTKKTQPHIITVTNTTHVNTDSDEETRNAQGVRTARLQPARKPGTPTQTPQKTGKAPTPRILNMQVLAKLVGA
jgi:hypothetical protein